MELQFRFQNIWMIELLHSTVTKLSNFVSIHIGFVTNMRHEQTLCITLDLIWRKLQVGGKIAFYFPTKTCCLLQTKSNVCNLKKMFESHKTCSNAAQQLVDGLLLWCATLSLVLSKQQVSCWIQNLRKYHWLGNRLIAGLSLLRIVCSILHSLYNFIFKPDRKGEHVNE